MCAYHKVRHQQLNNTLLLEQANFLKLDEFVVKVPTIMILFFSILFELLITSYHRIFVGTFTKNSSNFLHITTRFLAVEVLNTQEKFACSVYYLLFCTDFTDSFINK